MLENKFKTKLISEIKEMFPDCLVFHLNPNEHQGIPDLLILNEDKWAALEGKNRGYSSRRPNQEYYVEKMNNMSYASFVCPENKKEVLDDLCKALRP